MGSGVLFYLSTGLFLGWSLGANDAANVFGTAVGSRMVRFTTAAAICGVFVILGAVLGGGGAAHGLGKLGAVNALAGSFTVAFSAALTVYWMTRAGLPVSTTQAIVGAIVGWNFFSGSLTDLDALVKILGTWVACPLLGAVFAAAIYKITAFAIRWTHPHILRQDKYTRWGLILAGALGSYSLGANNIANVMGVFVDSSPFRDLRLEPWVTVTGTQQLFLLGAIAIAAGVFTYSKRVMITVGRSLMPLTPVAAWVVVMAHSVVLLLFSSTELRDYLIRAGLPPIPLVPVSSSQAVIGAVIGIGFVQSRGNALRQINWRQVANVASGWVSTPIVAAVVCYVLLFFVQNVFQDKVYREVHFSLTGPVIRRLAEHGIAVDRLEDLRGQQIVKAVEFRRALRDRVKLPRRQETFVIASAEIYPMVIDPEKLRIVDRAVLSPRRFEALARLAGRSFQHRWQLADALAEADASWRDKSATAANRSYSQQRRQSLEYLFRVFGTGGSLKSSGGRTTNKR